MVFDNSTKGFESLRAIARDLQNQHGLVEVVYGLEPTASYHKPLAEYLIRRDEHVVYVSNVAVAKNRALLDGRWDKNDKKDAANVADLVGQGRCLYYDVPEESLRELRSLIAFRIRLKKEEHALRMRLRNNVRNTLPNWTSSISGQGSRTTWFCRSLVKWVNFRLPLTLGKAPDESCAIGIVTEDVATLYAADDYMLQQVGNIDAGGSWHG